ncbi:hypothetical protein GH741_18360 [Aquibacillus halophilus]|uniref:YtxH domain-containing protein n=1 Tax=Aquibacillus halophilus TaxID=930132 RepID=A0A6A8DG36_9BACI|nr:hypothetical protein [Aquibacillus halophilus]MRH44613.1 hypothetical protein [Aquibacillus halophilus]
MAKHKLIKGVVIGGVIGGLATMLDRNTRDETLNKLKTAGQTANSYVKHPSAAFYSIRSCYESMSTDLTTGINSALTILTQVQETLDSVSKTKLPVDQPTQIVETEK